MNGNNTSCNSPRSKTDLTNQVEVNTPLKRDDHNIQYGSVPTTDDLPLTKAGTKEHGLCMKFFRVLITLTIEPLFFCFMFAYSMNTSILTNLMMDKGCLNRFNYSSEVCNNISGHPIEKKKVEILAADFSTYVNLLTLVGAFLMIFIAPWSDKHGRKPPLLFAVFGAILSDVGLILCILNFSSRLEYVLLARVPSEIFGGFICVLTVVYSHASEVSSERNRTLKYTSIEVSMGFGMAFGSLSGGFVYRYYGYTYVYVIVASLHVFCLLWAFFVVEETRGLTINIKWIDKIKDFFVCKNFKDSIKVTFREREGNTRALLLLLILSMSIIVSTYEAFNSIAYVYVHHIYNWDPPTFSVVNTTFLLIQMMDTLILVPVLIRLFKIKDFALGIFGTISLMAKNLTIAFAKYHTYIYYIGLFAGLSAQLSSLSVRAVISKMVDKDELGRVFSFLATCEAILPMLGTIAVTKLFEVTIDINPSVTYVISVILLLLPLGVFVWGYWSTNIAYNTLKLSDGDPVREKA